MKHLVFFTERCHPFFANKMVGALAIFFKGFSDVLSCILFRRNNYGEGILFKFFLFRELSMNSPSKSPSNDYKSSNQHQKNVDTGQPRKRSPKTQGQRQVELCLIGSEEIVGMLTNTDFRLLILD